MLARSKCVIPKLNALCIIVCCFQKCQLLQNFQSPNDTAGSFKPLDRSGYASLSLNVFLMANMPYGIPPIFFDNLLDVAKNRKENPCHVLFLLPYNKKRSNMVFKGGNINETIPTST